MLDKISKKIKGFLKSPIKFFKDYLPQIVFLVFTYQFLAFLNTLPYFNIINKYYYYIAAILWILANFFFKEYITNRRILIFGIAMFVLAIPFAIIELEFITDVLGFVAYVFIFTYVLREIFVGRKNLDIKSVK